MKRLLLLFSLVIGLCLPAFAQTGAIVRTVPLSLTYGPMVSGGTWCTPDLTTYPYATHSFIYAFPDGAPSAVTLTITGSTNGRTFTSVTTASTTTGGSISVSGVYTGLCITATTLTGSGVTVAGTYTGIPTTGAVSVDTAGLATSANQTNGLQLGQICDAGGDCATVTGSKLDVNATVSTTGLATSAIQTDGTQKSQIVDGSGNVIGATSNALKVTGIKTNNNAAPGATNIGALVGIANVAAPTYTEGDQVLLSTDLTGAVRVSGGGGGTQYTQDAALTVASTVMTMAGGRASAAVPTDVSADNDAVLPWYLRSGAAAVQLTYGGVLATADCATSTTVCTAPVPIGGVYYTSPTALTDGQVGYALLDTGHRQVVVGAGTAGTAAGGVATIQGVASMTPVLTNPGTATLWGVYVEDAAETAGGNLMMAGAVRRDTPASSSGTTGDNSTINVNADGALWTSNIPNTTGGWSSLNATAADGATACTSTVQAIKASAGTFGGYFFNNPNTADSWVQIYNVASGSVTVGTTNPALTFRLPGTASNSVAANVEFSNGINFSTAMSMACTTTAGGNGNPSNALEGDVLFK